MSRMKQIQQDIINLTPVYIYYSDGKPVKYMRDKGFNDRILIRYDTLFYDKMRELFQSFNIDIQLVKKTRKNNDTEKVQLYQFDKIMEFNNIDDGFYEQCGIITIVTNTRFNREKVSEFICDEMRTFYKDTKIQHKKITTSISCKKSVSFTNDCFTGDNGVDIRYKINILSLGRYKDKLGTTHKILSKMKIHHFMFVESDEYELYNNWINQEYCQLINSGYNYSKELNEGGQHIRNFIIEYWLERGEEFIWMLDDNIKKYLRLWRGNKIEIESKEIFTSIEHYISHFDNIGLCSHNINGFVNGNGRRDCITKNGKHFSSLLINIRTGLRFRFKYNEDHILSIDNLCSGYQTLCFNHIMYDKPTSGKQKGGNSGIYNSQGNQNGYNKKCYETIDFIRLQIGVGNIQSKNFDKLFKIEKKNKNGVMISHLQINYDYIESDTLLRQNREMTEFNSKCSL